MMMTRAAFFITMALLSAAESSRAQTAAGRAWFGVPSPSGLGDPHRPVVDTSIATPKPAPPGEERDVELAGPRIRKDLESIVGFSKADRAAGAKAWGRIDGLINNAGTTHFNNHANLEGLSADDFHRIYGVNVIGPYQMTRAVAEQMKKQGNGSIVNVSSVAGVMGVGSSIAYTASKGALNTMTLSLARALGPEIRVNTICPGFITGRWLRGGMGDEAYEAAKAHQERATPLRKAGTPEDMAQAAVWFIEGADLITGEILIVDAGSHLGSAPLIAR